MKKANPKTVTNVKKPNKGAIKNTKKDATKKVAKQAMKK